MKIFTLKKTYIFITSLTALPSFITSVRGVGTFGAPLNKKGAVLSDDSGSIYASFDGELAIATSLSEEPADTVQAVDVFGLPRGDIGGMPVGSYLGLSCFFKENPFD